MNPRHDCQRAYAGSVITMQLIILLLFIYSIMFFTANHTIDIESIRINDAIQAVGHVVLLYIIGGNVYLSLDLTPT